MSRREYTKNKKTSNDHSKRVFKRITFSIRTTSFIVFLSRSAFNFNHDNISNKKRRGPAGSRATYKTCAFLLGTRSPLNSVTLYGLFSIKTSANTVETTFRNKKFFSIELSRPTNFHPLVTKRDTVHSRTRLIIIITLNTFVGVNIYCHRFSLAFRNDKYRTKQKQQNVLSDNSTQRNNNFVGFFFRLVRSSFRLRYTKGK